ncbi:MAG: hypothetical protein IKR19_00515 [Acholeplasmatales bacterium]|nr:hypothetical protein [Acholeplasmatales bacterium]
MTTKTKRYSELQKLNTFEERFEYTKLDGQVGLDTFGFDRYMNQQFYRSKEWRDIRDKVIIRDNACDLGMPGHEIRGRVYIHHLNPLTPEDIEESTDLLFDLDNLICVSQETHNAIHYGDDSILDKYKIIERTPKDTCPWKR